MLSLLDNPIWHALNTLDAGKNIGNHQLAYLDADISPFIGMASWDRSSQEELHAGTPRGRTWFLLIKEPVTFIDELATVSSIPLFQFYCPGPAKLQPLKEEKLIVPLNDDHIDQMVALATLTKPGPFGKRTKEFGNYHGIFDGKRLVAMGGERLHLPGYTEISAICTHPDYQGRGYGAMMVGFLARQIFQKAGVPFLHARTNNQQALKIYRAQGFEVREEIQFYIFRINKMVKENQR
jgi:ribosomal protein S18 acetylase RimI-like enzyme